MLASVMYAFDEDVASQNKIHIRVVFMCEKREGWKLTQLRKVYQCWLQWEVETISRAWKKTRRAKNE